ISNDDGIFAEGLRVLADVLEALGEVWVVAPDRERSGSGHSLTLHHPLRVEEVQERWYAVDGTPTDCVYLGINGIFKGERPAIVVSGINQGGNLGEDITYSGTVCAAMEGAILGTPSMAVSLVTSGEYRFETAARVSHMLAELLLERGLPEDTFLNVNVPAVAWDELQGIKITRQGKRIYTNTVEEKVDPRGRTYYWIGGKERGWHQMEGSDLHTIAHNMVSITPLHLDLTDYDAQALLSAWNLAL
ncbi:MAG: 5'/3'-nucleotidase SurE, partial [Candidatus Tectimicrobiota bacterium]